MIKLNTLRMGEIIRENRDRLDLSVEDLGKKVGAGPYSVMRWESGQRVPRMDYAVRLADLFGCKITDLIVIEK